MSDLPEAVKATLAVLRGARDGDSDQAVAGDLITVLYPLIGAQVLEIRAGVYRARPDRSTTHDEVADTLSQAADRFRQEYTEERLRTARRQHQDRSRA